MIRSMTGFGRAERERQGRVLAVEMRTVNHRGLELSLRLPRGLDAVESDLRALVQNLLTRGKVHVTVSWKSGGTEGVELTVDWDLAQRTRAALDDLRRRLGLADQVTLAHLMAAPDLLVWREPDVDPEDAWAHLKETVEAAAADLTAMRQTEGQALAREFLARLDRLAGSVSLLRARSPERAREAKERLHERVTELLAGEATVDPERLLMEAAFQAERMDATEECVRLESHLEQFREIVAAGGPVGRKLNFLTQEMNREANTIGAKANDVTVSREVIAMKEEIEILREQVQNVE